MRHLRKIFVSLILLLPVVCFSQQSILQLGLWNIIALSGELKLGGLYGGGSINTYGIKNNLTETNYYGGIYVKTSSFVWNPNFLTVDVDGGYFPESRQDMYLVSPDLYNVINTKKLHIGATLFPRKIISLSGHINWDNSYDNRENLTNIQTNSKSYGGSLSFRSKYLPLTMNYNQSNWDSREVLTGRDFTYHQKNFEARVNRSFFGRDNNSWVYTHYEYTTKQYTLATIGNRSDNLNLQDGFFLDSSRRSMFNSNILGTIQRGSDSFNQFRANESLFLRFPHKLTFNTAYAFYYLQQWPEKLQQHTVNCLFGHQLFESLHSGLLYEYNGALESSYNEINNRVGIELNYTKKTIADGLLNIQYGYYRINENRRSTDVNLIIQNEPYVISDRVILKRPYTDLNSLVLKDSTQTIIYQLGVDYALNELGNFTEILRIPGGLIPDNGKIFAFYTAIQPGSYSYNINQNNFSINYSLFKGLIDLYYRTIRTEYSQIHHADNLLLDYLTDELVGANLKYKSATVGAEYDKYQSSLVPYRMIHYFFSWQGRYKQKLVFGVNANYRDYKVPSETEHRNFEDLNAMAAYAFNAKSKFDLTIGYQAQQGQQINLDYFSLRAKYSTIIRKLTCVVGADAYNRVYLETQKTNYTGVYFQVIKKFKY